MKINLLGAEVSGRSIAATAQSRTNFYLEVAPGTGDKAKVVAYPTPGLTIWDSGYFAAAVRGMLPFFDGTDALAVVGDYNDSGTKRTMLRSYVGNPNTVNSYQLASPAAYSNEQVVMATWGSQLVIALGDTTFRCFHSDTNVVDSGSLAFMSDSITWTAFLAGRFLINGNQSTNPGQFYWSNLYDGSLSTGWNTLYYATAEAHPDKLTMGLAYKGILVLFGERSTEFWQPTGDLNLPYQSIGGSVGNFGIAANDRHSAKVAGDTLLFCATLPNGSRSVCRLNGYSAEPVSPPDLDYLLRRDFVDCNASGVVFRVSGHDFYLLNLDSGSGRAGSWLYDITSGIWSKWNSPGYAGSQINCCASYQTNDNTSGGSATLVYYSGLSWRMPGSTAVGAFSTVILDGGTPVGWTSTPASGEVTIPSNQFTVTCTIRDQAQTTTTPTHTTGRTYTISSSSLVSVDAMTVLGKEAVFRHVGTTLTLQDPLPNTITADITDPTQPAPGITTWAGVPVYSDSAANVYRIDTSMFAFPPATLNLNALYLDGQTIVRPTPYLSGGVWLINIASITATGSGVVPVEATFTENVDTSGVACTYDSGSTWAVSQPFDKIVSYVCNGHSGSTFISNPVDQTLTLTTVPGTVVATYTSAGTTVNALRTLVGTTFKTVCEIDGNTYTEPDVTNATATLAREIVLPHTYDADNNNRLIVNRVRVEADTDGPLILSLNTSRDGGRSYGGAEEQTVDATSDPPKRGEWRRRGMGRDYVFKVAARQGGKCVLLNAWLDAEVSGS